MEPNTYKRFVSYKQSLAFLCYNLQYTYTLNVLMLYVETASVLLFSVFLITHQVDS